MYCGQNGYSNKAIMYDSSCNYYRNDVSISSPVCGCSDFQSNASDTFINVLDFDLCNVLQPSIECTIADSPNCMKQCDNDKCAGDIISGADIVSSLTVNCDSYRACQSAKILCSTMYN